MKSLIRRPEEIRFEEVITKYGIKSVVACFSGGKDSLVATHLIWKQLQKHPNIRFEVCHVDTGIALPGTLEYVKQVSHDLGWKLVILKPKIDFFSMAKRQGMPAPNRRWCCYHIKLEPLIRYTRLLPPPRVQITGMRAKESSRRSTKANRGEIRQLEWRWERGCYLYSPVFWWNTKTIDEYIQEHDLPINPHYATIQSSGECICGVYIKRSKLIEIARLYPEFIKKFEDIEKNLRKGGSAFYDSSRKEKVYISDLLREASAQTTLDNY